MPEVRVEIKASGPLATGRDAGASVREYVTEVMAMVADQASADVHENADRSFKRPTPYYETQIRRFRRGRTQVVDDRGVIYGPWLEGISERNATTRFKGYHLWRRARDSAEARFEQFAKRAWSKYKGWLT